MTICWTWMNDLYLVSFVRDDRWRTWQACSGRLNRNKLNQSSEGITSFSCMILIGSCCRSMIDPKETKKCALFQPCFLVHTPSRIIAVLYCSTPYNRTDGRPWRNPATHTTRISLPPHSTDLAAAASSSSARLGGLLQDRSRSSTGTPPKRAPTLSVWCWWSS